MVGTKKRKRDALFNEKEISFLAGIFRISKRRRKVKQVTEQPVERKQGEDVAFCVGKSTLQRKSSLRRRLSKRVSKQIVESKLKKFQDYSSLPSSDNVECIKALEKTRSNYFSDQINLDFMSDDKRFSMDSCTNDDGEDTPAEKLRERLDYAIHMKEQCIDILSTASRSVLHLEAAKNLLISDATIMACANDYNNLRDDSALSVLPSRGKLCISDIRIPLMWKDKDHFNNKGDYRRYGAFCLLKIGSQVYGSTTVSNIDRTMTDLTFDNTILFHDVLPDFELTLEVYCHKLQSDLSIASTPIRLKKKLVGLSGSIGRQLGKKLSGLQSAEVIGNMVLGPKFQLIATGTMRLSDTDDSIVTHDLEIIKQDVNSSCDLPLFGNYCCRTVVQPSCLVEATASGYLKIKTNSGNGNLNGRYWCELMNLQINCWNSKEDSKETEPALTIPVTKTTEIRRNVADNNKRTNKCGDITIINENEHCLVTGSLSAAEYWWDALEQHLLDQTLWNIACEQKMTISESSLSSTPLTSSQQRLASSSDSIRKMRRRLNFSQLNETMETLLEEDEPRRGNVARTSELTH